MLESITYGTYILFGILTYIGAGFVYFVVPETKRLTLEEMVRHVASLGRALTNSTVLQDIIFGSEGTARADMERMEEVHRDIGFSSAFASTSPTQAPESTAGYEKQQTV